MPSNKYTINPFSKESSNSKLEEKSGREGKDEGS